VKVRWGAVLFILALAAVCQSTASSSPSTTASANPGSSGTATPEIETRNINSKFSGFLGDYSQLKPAPDREGVLLFIDRSADYRPYTKVRFDPVQIYLTPNPDYPEVPHHELTRMSDSLMSSFKHALEPAYQIVTQPGPDVLRVRTAITGLQPVKPPAGVVDYLPVKAIFNVGRDAAGAGPRVAEMSVEIEVLDPSGKRVAAATATRKGEQTLAQGNLITWHDLHAINEYWAKSFRHRLDELREAGPHG
jgi:hypothetical protein